jgi:outer membrane protein OmpA-like peptidoglycan-associated protein
MNADGGEGGDGSDVFWPGYVDAVTNLVLNLLFLITIMTVAVFMFALELGRISGGGGEGGGKGGGTTQVDAQESALAQTTEPGPEKSGGAEAAATTTEVVSASSSIPPPQKGLDKAIGGDSEVTVQFMDDAVTLTPEELPRLRKALEPFAAQGKARIEVVVPKGFSESKRLGFYRAMAVRNLLLEMKIPNDRIELLVREGKSTANASLVRVSLQR